MSWTMHRAALLVACLACASYGRVARASSEKEQRSPPAQSEINGRKLAMLLLAAPPAAAFSRSSSAVHSATRGPASFRNPCLHESMMEPSGKHKGVNLRLPIVSMTADSPSVALDAKTNEGKIAAFMKRLRSKVADTKFVERVNRVSNFASILCAIDCTVFPLLLTLLPIINAASSGAASAWLHKASHACALWFVGPVGGLAVTFNLLQHKRPLVGLWGYCGIAIILLANIHLPHVILGLHVPHGIAHGLHERHEIINIFGCALLLSSQRFAHSLTCCNHGNDCNHDHSHSHNHKSSQPCAKC
mmetsp:Transcript_42938/g.79792  ORF Transcript_42938/g.79792 Transcript_42938/m.79792 type:complete len:303 (-) Transcript_42938:105-1013(-)